MMEGKENLGKYCTDCGYKVHKFEDGFYACNCYSEE